MSEFGLLSSYSHSYSFPLCHPHTLVLAVVIGVGSFGLGRGQGGGSLENCRGSIEIRISFSSLGLYCFRYLTTRGSHCEIDEEKERENKKKKRESSDRVKSRKKEGE